MIPAKHVAAQLVATKAKEIDLDRVLSTGPGGSKTLIDEQRSNQVLSWEIANASASAILIAIAPLINHQYADETALKSALGVGAVLKTGTLATDVTATPLNSGRVISELLRYAGNSPLRMTKWSLASVATSGAAETTNYNNSIKFVWFSPFQKTDEKELSLRKFQNSKANQPQYAEVDFIREGYHAIVSAEHAMIIQVNAGTKLTITADFGAQLSAAQRYYRMVKEADKTLAPYRQTAPEKC